MLNYDRKVSSPISLPASWRERLSKEAERETEVTGQYVSASEIVRRALALYWQTSSQKENVRAN